MIGANEKGDHYISLLENARVKGAWTELPELIRKVNKHAAGRKTLIQTATAEHEIATAIGKQHLTSTSTTLEPQALATLSSALRTDGGQHSEDSFQGKTCLLWSQWLGLQKSAGVTGFGVKTAIDDLQGGNLSGWTKICIVKSAYIEGTSCIKNGRPNEAQKIFNVALSRVKSDQELILSAPQFAYWMEQLLAQSAVCLNTHDDAVHLDHIQFETLRHWATITSKTREVSRNVFGNSTAHISRLSVWKLYHGCLSSQLIAPSSDTRNNDASFRLRLSTELRRVERAYETELLRVSQFPTATQNNVTIEEWVEVAIQNWQVLCGTQWNDKDIGDGGRDTISRDMLDVLYRAASKTFQSTLILRRLFQVHLSLGEFDLAYRSFDTYIDLVDKRRIRAAKSGRADGDNESEAAVLATICEAILSLCKYGQREQAQKSYTLSLKLETLLLDSETDTDAETTDNSSDAQPVNSSSHPALKPSLLQTAYHAVGAGKANWARWTPFNESRSSLQEEALMDLRKACSYGETMIETHYTMSLLLAETRDIPAAIIAAKDALTKVASSLSASNHWIVERKLVAVWHLLALLLSSRQDFDNAIKSCVAAFEQFAMNDISFGHGQNQAVVSDIENQFDRTLSGMVDELSVDELQRFIDTRTTELALMELTEGPEEAVNFSNELLSLFSRLYSHIQVPLDKSTTARKWTTTKTSAGTAGSIRASIFGRKNINSPAGQFRQKGASLLMADGSTRPTTSDIQAPVIQVTSEDEKPISKRLHIRKSLESSRKRATTHGPFKKVVHDSGHQQRDDNNTQPSTKIESPKKITTSRTMDGSGPSLVNSKLTKELQNSSAVTKDTSVNGVAANDSRDEQPIIRDHAVPTPDTHITAITPATRFPRAYGQKQGLSVLVKVWLIIAKLYRRANMFDDSKEAWEEANQAAAKIETMIGSADYSARALRDPGWGVNCRSVDETWADVHYERAELQLAIYRHKIKDSEPSTATEDLRAALDEYEQCLMFVPDHPGGIVGLSNILLDSFEKKVDLSRRVNDGRLQLSEQEHDTNVYTRDPPSRPTTTNSQMNGSTTLAIPNHQTNNHNQNRPVSPAPSTTRANSTAPPSPSQPNPNHQHQNSLPANTTTTPTEEESTRKTPENLNRIAARDRAYGLLSGLTKSGSGWDDSAAWFALARAHELGGEFEKAQEVLWWCVELEDTRPVRSWRNLGYCL